MRLGFSKALISLVQNGERSASEQFRAKCLEAYAIPLEDWAREDPESITPECAVQPVSEKRPARKLGTTREELWATVEEIDTELRGNSLSSTARASLIGKRSNTLGAIGRLEKAQALEDHPDFEAFRADILGAIKDAFGDLVTPDRLRVLGESMRRRGKASKKAAA
jgi:transcriptional regulator with XRE-family HTH domain